MQQSMTRAAIQLLLGASAAVANVPKAVAAAVQQDHKVAKQPESAPNGRCKPSGVAAAKRAKTKRKNLSARKSNRK